MKSEKKHFAYAFWKKRVYRCLKPERRLLKPEEVLVARSSSVECLNVERSSWVAATCRASPQHGTWRRICKSSGSSKKPRHRSNDDFAYWANALFVFQIFGQVVFLFGVFRWYTSMLLRKLSKLLTRDIPWKDLQWRAMEGYEDHLGKSHPAPRLVSLWSASSQPFWTVSSHHLNSKIFQNIFWNDSTTSVWSFVKFCDLISPKLRRPWE